MSCEVAEIAFMTDHIRPGGDAPEVAAADQPESLASITERARTGDAKAFEQLMICTQHRVAATAWRMLGNREDTRDATQEVYLRTYKYLRGYKAGQDFHGWLYRVTVNVCRDMLRARRHAGRHNAPVSSLNDECDAPRLAQEMCDALAGAEATEEATLRAEHRAIVGRALATLPEKERTAIILRDLEGLSTEAVARLMKTRPATVRSQVSTARAKIKSYCAQLLRRQRRPADAVRDP